eukprot:588696_1
MGQAGTQEHPGDIPTRDRHPGRPAVPTQPAPITPGINPAIYPPKPRPRKAGSTTTVPPQYNLQSSRTFHNVKRHRDALVKQQAELKHTNTHLQTEINTKQKTVQSLLSAQSIQNTQIQALQSQVSQCSQYKQQILSKDQTIESLQNTIRHLKADLSSAQQTILSMTSVVDVNQKMPTVDELLVKFQSMRDQQHADLCTTLKRVIKAQHPKWQKYYIVQLIHKLAFNALILTYNVVKDYKDQLYDRVADELNMKNTILKSMDDDEKSLSAADIEDETHRVLGNMFGAYFKHNFEFILKKDAAMNTVMGQLLEIWKGLELNELNESDIEHVRLYIAHCCDICWIMVLQNPVLDFYPMEWECEEEVVYTEDIYRKVLGSDRKAKHVLYYVWPVMRREDNVCGNYKIDVVIKDEFYAKTRDKKRRSSQNIEPDLEDNTQTNDLTVKEEIKTNGDDDMTYKQSNDVNDKQNDESQAAGSGNDGGIKTPQKQQVGNGNLLNDKHQEQKSELDQYRNIESKDQEVSSEQISTNLDMEIVNSNQNNLSGNVIIYN